MPSRRPPSTTCRACRVAADRVVTLKSPAAYRETLLDLIARARERILIASLYLQDDEAGREVLSALYAAKAARPGLEVAVFVDWHRAQRGLIGAGKSAGNAVLYRKMAQRLGPGIPVYGVPVQTREMLGVLHLKGFVVDDAVLYSGASLNDVYLHRGDRYRLDRYHVLQDRHLADSLAACCCTSCAPARPCTRSRPPPCRRAAQLRAAIVAFRRVLARTRYPLAAGTIRAGEVGVTPLLGLGARDNALNTAILKLIGRAKHRLVLFTPYFNLPGPVRKALDAKLREGCHVTIVVGDKVANDFFIPPEEPFKAIGALPYLYEMQPAPLLQGAPGRHRPRAARRAPVAAREPHVPPEGPAGGREPRAPHRQQREPPRLAHGPRERPARPRPARPARAQHRAELERILAHTRRIAHSPPLEAVASYPAPVRRLITRLARTRLDRLVNQVL